MVIGGRNIHHRGAIAVELLRQMVEKHGPLPCAALVFQLRDGWHVMWDGRACSPMWQDRGGAEAYISGLRAGRQPEYRLDS